MTRPDSRWRAFPGRRPGRRPQCPGPRLTMPPRCAGRGPVERVGWAVPAETGGCRRGDRWDGDKDSRGGRCGGGRRREPGPDGGARCRQGRDPVLRDGPRGRSRAGGRTLADGGPFDSPRHPHCRCHMVAGPADSPPGSATHRSRLGARARCVTDALTSFPGGPTFLSPRSGMRACGYGTTLTCGRGSKRTADRPTEPGPCPHGPGRPWRVVWHVGDLSLPGDGIGSRNWPQPGVIR